MSSPPPNRTVRSSSDYASHEPPDPPSFPTRRSSDLGAEEVEGPHAVPELQAQEADPPELRGAVRREGVVHLLRVVVPHQDRKSTRLNSSHVEISYAVFCLKKKNILKLVLQPGCSEHR